MNRLQKCPAESEIVRHGVLDEATSAWVSGTVLRAVIAPAAAKLLDTPLAA
jgi:hypothetical protein